MDKLYSIQEIAEKCHVSERTVYRMIAMGSLKAGRFGDKYIIEERDLLNYIRGKDD